ncbi:MAG: hypothetical protein M3Y73_04085 [Actinomycetota bacterium]|nr:hypothetical protein [Actinomycetota bacterium]
MRRPEITGRFATVTAGAGYRQDTPYRPLTHVFAEYTLRTHHDTLGTTVADRISRAVG